MKVGMYTDKVKSYFELYLGTIAVLLSNKRLCMAWEGCCHKVRTCSYTCIHSMKKAIE